MRKIIYYVAICLLCLTHYTHAQINKTRIAQIKLHSISVTKSSEKTGDELYMAITTYPSKGKATHYRFPKFPLHWYSLELAKVKNVKIWEQSLKEGEAATVILSLVEQDSPPWDTDDLLGTMRLKVKNEKGYIKADWKQPNSQDEVKSVTTKKANLKEFTLTGDNSEYTVYLQLIEKDAPKT